MQFQYVSSTVSGVLGLMLGVTPSRDHLPVPHQTGNIGKGDTSSDQIHGEAVPKVVETELR